MDPLTIALIAEASIKTAAQVRAIFSNTGATDEEKELQYAKFLADIKANQLKTYEDYDPNLNSELATQG